MVEPEPENPLSNDMYTALDIVGRTQLAHLSGYREKIRLHVGVAMGHIVENVRIGAMKHYIHDYIAERL